MSVVVMDAHAPDVIAGNLEQQAGGQWMCWYGQATGLWWAMPRPPYPWRGLLSADTPLGLLRAIGEVHAFYGPGRS